MTERFESHTRTFSIVTVASRVTGLVRDAALSRVFGAAGVTDAFFFAFIIPNLFRRLFGEGAVSAAFLRAFAQLDRTDPVMAGRLATLTIGFVLAAGGAITLVGELLLYALSLGAGHDSLTVRLTMIMLPYLPMICLVAVLGSMLQVRGRFGPTAGVPIVLNLCMIAATAGLAPLFGAERAAAHVTGVAAAVVVAGLLQVAWMAAALRGQGCLAGGARQARGPMGDVLRQAGPMILGLGVLQLNVFFDGVIAGYPTTVGPTILGAAYPLHTGALTAVSFAQRLYQFPLGVYGIALATTIYPALARRADDPVAFTDILRRGLRLVVFIGLPASAGLMMVAPLLARVIYEGGLFDAGDARRVAFVLLGYASGVWAYSTVHILTRAFYARGDAKTPVRVAVSVVGLNLVLNATLIWTPLRESGLAWSTAVCSAIQVAILLALISRRAGPIVDRAVVGSWARAAGATGIMAGAVAVALWALPEASTWTRALVNLVVAVASGQLMVLAWALAIRMPELRWIMRRN